MVTLNALMGISFTAPTTRFVFKTGNVRFLEEVGFGGAANIKGVVFRERIIDNGQVFALEIGGAT